jgi:hypothetical protein
MVFSDMIPPLEFATATAVCVWAHRAIGGVRPSRVPSGVMVDTSGGNGPGSVGAGPGEVVGRGMEAAVEMGQSVRQRLARRGTPMPRCWTNSDLRPLGE